MAKPHIISCDAVGGITWYNMVYIVKEPLMTTSVSRALGRDSVRKSILIRQVL